MQNEAISIIRLLPDVINQQSISIIFLEICSGWHHELHQPAPEQKRTLRPTGHTGEGGHRKEWSASVDSGHEQDKLGADHSVAIADFSAFKVEFKQASRSQGQVSICGCLLQLPDSQKDGSGELGSPASAGRNFG